MARKKRSEPTVLCIGGLDPSGGAGILADAEAAREAGARALCGATAITIQTGKGVRGFELLKPQLVLAQVAVLLEDERPDAVKLGMLGSPALVFALSALLGHHFKGPLVVDPVLRASTGEALFAGAAHKGYEPLLALGPIFTPNILEAEKLTGAEVIMDRDQMEAVARRLLGYGASAVVLKGGHLEGKSSPDLVLDGKRSHWLEGSRLPGTARGTGCRFASALAARLAAGDKLLEATKAAKALVRKRLSAS